MKNVNKDMNSLGTRIIDSGTVAINNKGNWVQKFPTEKEADEFINEQNESLNEILIDSY